MKRIKIYIIYTMLISAILTITTGIMNGVRGEANTMLHVVFSSIFFLACITHIVIFRKAFVRHLTGK